MVYGNEFSSSSLGFSISCYSSDGSSRNDIRPSTSLESSFSGLSLWLEKLLIGGEYDRYNDAEIEVEGITIGVNRGILAGRSIFFHDLFKKAHDNICRQKYLLSDLVPHGHIGLEAFEAVLNYMYTGKMKEPPIEVSTCVDESCDHGACGPAIAYAVEMMYAAATFQISELVEVVQNHLLTFVDKAFSEDVIPILVVAFRCELKQLLAHCVLRIARSDLDNTIMENEIPHEVLADIKSIQEEKHNSIHADVLNEKQIWRIHRALDSDDIELVKLLLDESNITLDSACALHYAAGYCNPKTLIGLLNMKIANINHRNARGQTVLHVAARRKDPSIVIELLRHGTSVFDATSDGRTPVIICRRLTRLKDFNEEIKQCRNTNKDRLCIDMLERKMRMDPSANNIIPMSAMILANDPYTGLLFFEIRVAMALHLFPSEAKLAIQVAEADIISEFLGISDRSMGEDLHKLTSEEVERWKRLPILQKTVDTGRHYFPKCSEVLDRYLADEISGTLLLHMGTVEEQRMKRVRYMELKADLIKAMVEDEAQHKRAACLSSSSSSSFPKGGAKRKTGRR